MTYLSIASPRPRQRAPHINRTSISGSCLPLCQLSSMSTAHGRTSSAHQSHKKHHFAHQSHWIKTTRPTSISVDFECFSNDFHGFLWFRSFFQGGSLILAGSKIGKFLAGALFLMCNDVPMMCGPSHLAGATTLI